MNIAGENTPGLADRFKNETWDLHKKAEKTGIIQDILKQQITLPHYTLWVRNLMCMYQSLESSTEWAKTLPALADFLDARLFRRSALEHDFSILKSQTGPGYAYPVLDATKQYCEHIENSLKTGSPAMIGHIYVRYLGDLNGGQVLQKILSKSLGLGPHALTFYDFSEIDDIVSFRTGFRDAFNRLELSDENSHLAIEGARAAFKFNISLSMSIKQTDMKHDE